MYDRSARPSPHTTPLARFATTRRQFSGNASPNLVAFAEARCEILSYCMPIPISMGIADDIVAVLGASGWKQREPTLLIQRLNRPPDENKRFESTYPEVGLQEVATGLRLDGGRKLVYVADGHRVKSYTWTSSSGNDDGGDDADNVLPVHTLDSFRFEHAMILHNSGAKLMRSGSKGMAIWDIDTLPTHGPDGTRIVGEKIRGEIDTSRDNDEDIERSRGAPPTQTIAVDVLANITLAEHHPSHSAQILALKRDRYDLASIDLETQQIAMRYLGHQAVPNCIALNNVDQDSFVTAASDGGVRLYDVRQPTPQFAIDHGSEKLYSALYESIGGQPFIIYGCSISEQIKVWDVRSRKPMYELATGNNLVQSLAWDGRRQMLLAATECCYRDRLGNSYDYRRAKIGKHGQEWFGGGLSGDSLDTDTEMNEDGDDNSDDDGYSDDDDDDDFEERAWPKDAWHVETSFGVALDAGDHTLFRYHFKKDANPRIFPEYGQAMPDNDHDRYW
ncbi:hypothetical protein K488DRAFT_53845 [Vararia minispora EC-137]|uniref:Uncharacterized protein n=1 Tax=Vararia minispora EC-137 TaxID=1314806 RepID=A0ACB8QG39_9AGAM|nr:hypothetical protein K488DRAFT_53845 [Vararia minispora EC-137]